MVWSTSFIPCGWPRVGWCLDNTWHVKGCVQKCTPKPDEKRSPLIRLQRNRAKSNLQRVTLTSDVHLCGFWVYHQFPFISYLVGGDWNMTSIFPYLEKSFQHSFQRGRSTTKQFSILIRAKRRSRWQEGLILYSAPWWLSTPEIHGSDDIPIFD